MRQYLVSALLFCIACASCNSSKHAGKNKSLPGTWQAQPIVIDADSKDWPSPYPNYDSKPMIGYATSNDKQYLYITMETGDEYAMMKILKAGMMVWIDTNGGKEQSFTIHYPLPDDGGESFDLDRGSREKKGGLTGAAGYDSKLRSQDFNAKAKRAVGSAAQMTIEGSPYCSGGFAVTQSNPCGIMVRMGIDEYKELIWEAAIPFKAIYGKDALDKSDAGRPISVCYAIKGFKRPKTNNETTNSGGMGSGGSGMGGGGMQGGGRGGRGGKGSQGKMNGTDPKDMLYESTKTFKYFGLVYQQ